MQKKYLNLPKIIKLTYANLRIKENVVYVY